MNETPTREAMVIDTLLERLASRGSVPDVQGIAGTFQLDVENVGRWYVTVDNDRITVSQGVTEADCALGCSAPVFIRMMEGEQNLLTGFLCGRIRAAGDLTLAAGFDRLLPVQ